MDDNIMRAAGPGGEPGGLDSSYVLTHTGAQVDAAVTGWHAAQAQADATAADIAQGKKAITAAGLVTGTMEAGGGSYDPLDPMSVYKATRPADWLPMPEPAEGEAYMLYLVPPTDQALFAVQVTFTGDATIQLGDAEPITLASGTPFETTFDWNVCVNPTSDGFKQVMIKISGNNINELSFAEHSLKSNHKEYPILDFSGNLPEATSIKTVNKRTKYFSLSKSSITNMSSMFSACHSLLAITRLDTHKVTLMSSAFLNCYALIAIPHLDTSLVTGMASMFSACYSIKGIPEMDTSNVVSMNNTFYNCRSLERVPVLDTGKVTNISGMFYYCYSLSEVLQLDVTNVTSTTNLFFNCSSLSRLTCAVKSSVTRSISIMLTSSIFSRTAILELFESLPVVDGMTPKINLAGNPGTASLTAEDKAIATGKGWTLTL